MTGLEELRDGIAAATQPVTEDDALALVGKLGLRAAFNERMPSHLQLDATGDAVLQVTPTRVRLTSMDLAFASEAFARAVAAIGREITKPAERFGKLHASDYARAPIYTTSSPAGHLTFRAAAGGVFLDQSVGSLAEQALERLVNLLPSEPDDDALERRVLALRAPSARALLEVSHVAKRLDGLRLTLRSSAEQDVRSVVTHDQADYLDEILDQFNAQTHVSTVYGRLDGLRYRRRMFYLETDAGKEIAGVVDEHLVAQVNELLNTRVSARVERVEHHNRAGIAQKPTYRLVHIAAAPALPQGGS